MNKFTLGLLAAVFALETSASAQIIAIKFDSALNGTTVPITATTGVAPVAPSGWNEISGYKATDVGPIYDSMGDLIQGATLSFSSNNNYSTTNTNLGGIFDTYIDSGSISVTLTNIPYATYDVYAYVGADANTRPSTGGTVGSETLSFTTDARDATSFTINSNPSAVDPLANVLLFSDVSSSTLTYTQVGSVAGAGNGINAIEIVKVNSTATPEPSTYALMLGGLAILGICLRRRSAILT